MGDQGDFSDPQPRYDRGYQADSLNPNDLLIMDLQSSHTHSSGHSVSNWAYLDMNRSIDDLGGSAHLLGGPATDSASGQYGVRAQVGPDLGGFNGAGGETGISGSVNDGHRYEVDWSSGAQHGGSSTDSVDFDELEAIVQEFFGVPGQTGVQAGPIDTNIGAPH
jgi:hypothetical protein